MPAETNSIAKRIRRTIAAAEMGSMSSIPDQNNIVRVPCAILYQHEPAPLKPLAHQERISIKSARKDTGEALSRGFRRSAVDAGGCKRA